MASMTFWLVSIGTFQLRFSLLAQQDALLNSELEGRI